MRWNHSYLSGLTDERKSCHLLNLEKCSGPRSQAVCKISPSLHFHPPQNMDCETGSFLKKLHANFR